MINLEIKRKNRNEISQPGSVILKTCNRSEIYSGSGDIPENVIRHLFRITTGLESSLIGENAIQGQVKDAYLRASNTQLSSSIHKLFQRALYVGKKVRTETGINKGAVSHSQAAVDLLLNLKLNLNNSNITLIGAHNMNEKILYHLVRKGAKTLFLGNRTYNKARTLAERYTSKAFYLKDLNNILKKTDILITATSAPHTIINLNNFPDEKEMTIVDLAVPEDVDKKVRELKSVKYFNNVGVEKTVNQNLNLREKEINLASEIVEEEVKDFINKLKNDKERSL